jgi:hypothetical protein
MTIQFEMSGAARRAAPFYPHGHAVSGAQLAGGCRGDEHLALRGDRHSDRRGRR